MQLRTYMAAVGTLLGIAAIPAVCAAQMDVSKCPVNQQWQDAYNKGDADAVAALYTPSAIEVTPQGIRVGPVAVKERVQQSIKQLKNAVIIATKCEVGDAFRWSAGTWKSESSQGPVGGFWTAIEIKDSGGSWKMQNLTYNLTPPPPSK